MGFTSTEQAQQYVVESNNLFFQQLGEILTQAYSNVSEEEYQKILELATLYKDFIDINPYYRFTNPTTSLALGQTINNTLIKNFIPTSSAITQNLYFLFTPKTEVENDVINYFGLQQGNNNFEDFYLANKKFNITTPFSAQPLMDFKNKFDFEKVRQAVSNHETYNYLNNYQELKEKFERKEITSDVFGIKLLSSNNEFVLKQLNEAKDKYINDLRRKIYNAKIFLSESQYAAVDVFFKQHVGNKALLSFSAQVLFSALDIFSKNSILSTSDIASIRSTFHYFDTNIKQAMINVEKSAHDSGTNQNIVSSDLLSGNVIDENVVGIELLKGDIVVNGLKSNNSNGIDSAAIISDKLDLGNGKCLIEVSNQNSIRTAKTSEFEMNDSSTSSVAIARVKTTVRKREEVAKFAKELSVNSDTVYAQPGKVDNFHPANGWDFRNGLGATSRADSLNGEKPSWNCAAFVAYVFQKIGVKIYNSFFKNPKHIDLSELITNKNVSLITDDLHSYQIKNAKKNKANDEIGKPKFSKSGVKYRFVKTWGGYAKEILDDEASNNVIAIKKYNKKFDVTKNFNINEEYNIVKLLVNKLVKSTEANDLDTQKEILTKLHKHGFDDSTISTLVISTSSNFAYKKAFDKNSKLLEKNMSRANRENILDKQKELKENILDNTNHNKILIINTINNKISVPNNSSVTLQAVLSTQPLKGIK